MNPLYYKSLETIFDQELKLLTPVLTNIEKEEVREFLIANEYGVALQTLRDLLVEENKKISKEAFDLLEILAKNMKIYELIITPELKKCVI